MKSLTKIFSFGPKVRKAEINSGSVYSLTVNECIGPRPFASHKTRTFKTSEHETIFSAVRAGFSDRSHFLTTCADTPTRFANASVSVIPAASIAARKRAPKVIAPPFSFYETGAGDYSQDTENKVSHFLSFIKFSFAAASQPSRPSRAYGLLSSPKRACRIERKFIRCHSHSFPFFAQVLLGDAIATIEKLCGNTAMTQWLAMQHGGSIHFETLQEKVARLEAELAKVAA